MLVEWRLVLKSFSVGCKFAIVTTATGFWALALIPPIRERSLFAGQRLKGSPCDTLNYVDSLYCSLDFKSDYVEALYQSSDTNTKG